MDQFQPSGNPYGQPYHTPYRSNHSERMAIISMTLGMIALISCTCLYLSIPCGALAIIFATLSRGGQMRYSGKAQMGLILGAAALILTVVRLRSIFCFGTRAVWQHRWYPESLLRHDRHRLQRSNPTALSDTLIASVTNACSFETIKIPSNRPWNPCMQQDEPFTHPNGATPVVARMRFLTRQFTMAITSAIHRYRSL